VSLKSGSSSTSQITGYRYEMAFHMGICHAPINELNQINVGDLTAWIGSLQTTDFATIDQPDLFGGDTKEGGIVGTFKLFLGLPDQVVDDIIVEQLTPGLPVPGWRGVTTLFYYGQISSNNPYPKVWKVRANRSTAGWENGVCWYADKCRLIVNEDLISFVIFDNNPEDGDVLSIGGVELSYVTADADEHQVLIGSDISTTIDNTVTFINFNHDIYNNAVASGTGGNQMQLLFSTPTTVVETVGDFITVVSGDADIKAMNPAHIIYECCTNTVWGRGYPVSFIDDSSFRATADKLYDEGLGLCFRWTRQEDVDRFVQKVIDHIGAVLYIDRTSGLLTLDLIRDDYDPDTLTTYGFDSGLLDITEDESASADTSYNEIIVKYTSPLNGKAGQIRVQNLASFQSVGAVISTTVEYPGVPTATLAGRLGMRDLRVSSGDLRRFKLKMDRRGFYIKPGGVFKIHAPTRGVESIIVRAGTIEDTTLTDGTITVGAVQDVFTLDDATYLAQQPSYFIPAVKEPRIIQLRDVGEMTWYDAADNLPPLLTDQLDNDTGVIKVFAANPGGGAIEYRVTSRAGGETLFGNRSIAGFDTAATLRTSMGCYTTDIEIEPLSGLLAGGVAVGQPVLIGEEYCEVVDFDVGAKTLTVARGCIDTIPTPHSVGDTIWFQTHSPTTDFRDYATGEDVEVKLLTRTSSQQLDASLAPVDTVTIAARQARPYPPGNVLVNTVGFCNPHVISGDITLTWAHRDRIVQGNVLLDHSAASTGPETGVTYTVRVYDGTTLLRTVTGITGTTLVYDTTMAAADGDPGVLWFELESVRDGLASWQHYRFAVSRPATFDFGFDFDFDGTL